MVKEFMKLKCFSIGFLLMGIVLSGGCGKKSGPPAMERVVPVRVVAATLKDVPLYIDGVGICSAYEWVNIYPQVSGQILSEHFEQGRTVEKGQLLYQIDGRIFEAQVEQARGKVQMVEAKLAVDRARLERSQDLLAKDYISRQDYESLQASVTEDEGQLAAARGALKQAETNLDFCSIRSPIRGLAGATTSHVGNVVSSNDMALNGKPLVVIQAIDPLYIDFAVSENEFSQLLDYFLQQQWLDCDVWLLSDRSVQAKARLEIINNQVSRGSGNVKLRAVMENPNMRFWPGQSVGVRVILSQLQGAILVPESAVGLSQVGHYVFVVNGQSRAEVRTIETGQSHGEEVVVLKGLQAGDRVVTEGQFILAPNTQVAVDSES